MKLRIESDGTRKGTRILVGDGEEVEGVEKVTWEFDQGEEFVRATIKLSEVGLSAPEPCGKDIL